MAISAAVGAFESRWLLRSLFTPGSFLCGSLIVLSLARIVPCQTATLQAERSLAWHSHLLGVDVALNRVPFACINEPQFRASRFSITLDQLPIKIFGNAACVHSPHMAESPEASLSEKGVDTAHFVTR